MKTITAEVLIIGAGPAGTVAAAYLKQQNIDVRIVERTQFPRFVIGESLLPSSMDHLEEAGLLDAAMKGGFEEKHGVRFIRENQVCAFDFSEQFTSGWTWTWQLPRADFDKVLADEAERKGVPVSYQTEVLDIRFDDLGADVFVRNATEEYCIRAGFVLDCSGYGRVLPRLLNLDAPSDLTPKVSFFTHLKESSRPEGRAGTQITFIVLRQDVWFWIIPFSNGVTSVGFVGEPDFFEGVEDGSEKSFRELMDRVPELNHRFDNDEIVFAPKMIRAYSKSIKKLHGPRYALCGNSAEFLDPVFSSGVAFATASGLQAAKLITREHHGEKPDWETEFEQYMRHGVRVFQSFVAGWYNGNLQKVFFNDEINPVIKKQICSLLAGYVWDETNPVVKRHDTILETLCKVIDISRKETAKTAGK